VSNGFNKSLSSNSVVLRRAIQPCVVTLHVHMSALHRCISGVHACMLLQVQYVQVEPVACEEGERNQRTPSAPPQGHSQLLTCTHHC
jgi:hypothetical protein